MSDHKNFIELTNNNELFVTGEIGWDFSASIFMEELLQASKNEGPINVHFYSGGGSLFEALAVYDFVKLKGIEFNAFGSGLVGSAATIIMAAAKNAHIGANSFYFAHSARSENKELANKGTDRIVEIYKELTGLTRPQIRKVLAAGDNGHFMTADEAKNLNFINGTFKEAALAAHSEYDFKAVNFDELAKTDETPEEREDSNVINSNINTETMKEDNKSLVQDIVEGVTNSLKGLFTKETPEATVENETTEEVVEETKEDTVEVEAEADTEVEATESVNAELLARLEKLEQDNARLKASATQVEKKQDPAIVENNKKEADGWSALANQLSGEFTKMGY
jgi:ATP-dependent protease ClpP protease subunit